MTHSNWSNVNINILIRAALRLLQQYLFSNSPPEKKDTVLRQVRLDPCDLQPIFDDMLHILNPEELHVIEEIPAAEDKLDQLFEIAGVKSQEASQMLLDSVYSHLPDLL